MGLINIRIVAVVNDDVLYCAEFVLTCFNTVEQQQKQWHPQTGVNWIDQFL